MNLYVGVNGLSRRVKAAYIGVNGVSKRITAGYIGVNGVSKKFFEPSGSGHYFYIGNKAIEYTPGQTLLDRLNDSDNPINFYASEMGFDSNIGSTFDGERIRMWVVKWSSSSSSKYYAFIGPWTTYSSRLVTPQFSMNVAGTTNYDVAPWSTGTNNITTAKSNTKSRYNQTLTDGLKILDIWGTSAYAYVTTSGYTPYPSVIT